MPDRPNQLHATRASSDELDAGSAALKAPPSPCALGRARGFYRTGEAARILGVTRRQLQYWAATGLVAPSACTGGGHRRYTFLDLVALRAAKQLIDAGVPLQRIRQSIGSLQRMLPAVRQPLSELVLVATGDLVLVIRDGSAFEAVSGQEWILEVSRFERELRERMGPDLGRVRRSRAEVGVQQDGGVS